MNNPFARVHNRVCLEFGILVLSLTAVAAGGEIASDSALVFRVPDVLVQSDGTNPTIGMLNALLDLSGNFVTNPPSVSSLNVAFELTGHPAGVAFGTPLDPPINQLIPVGVPFTGATALPHVIRFAKDAPAPVAAIDGSLMVSVPFTIAPGTPAGTYPIQFIAGNELGTGDATALPITLVNGSITVAPFGLGITGDYNRNGVVDAADFSLWRNSLGLTGPDLAADGNGNNLIDDADYTVWRANFGRSGAFGAAMPGIPEPSTLVLMALAIAAMVACRSGGRSNWTGARRIQ